MMPCRCLPLRRNGLVVSFGRLGDVRVRLPHSALAIPTQLRDLWITEMDVRVDLLVELLGARPCLRMDLRSQ